MIVHALSGAASLATCLRLFRRYPLAVTLDSAHGACRSMVLMSRADGPVCYFVLTQARDDLFVIRSWTQFDGVNQQIRAGEPVSGVIHQVISDGMPVPRDGALLGWLTDNQVTVMLAVHSRQPEAWDVPVPAPAPEIRVMPMAGTDPLTQWPPFTTTPLGDGRLWEYVEWGQIVDVVPVITARGGHAYWVPSPGHGVEHGDGCVVIKDNLPAEEFWLPAGVYMDHWTLREGIEAPPVGRLLALPGVVDLAVGRA